MEVLQTEGDTTKQVDDTLEDLVEYADDEGQEAETITVKLTLQQKENTPALGDNLEVLNVLSDSDDVVEHVEDDAEGEVHGEGTDVIVLEKVHKTSKYKKHMSMTSLDLEYFPLC